MAPQTDVRPLDRVFVCHSVDRCHEDQSSSSYADPVYVPRLRRAQASPRSLPASWVDSGACLELRSRASPPVRTHAARGLFPRPSPRGDRRLGRQCFTHPLRLPLSRFLAPSAACASATPPGMLQPDPGFEVHDVALTSRAQPPRRPSMLLAVLALSRRAPSPVAAPTMGVVAAPRWVAPFEDFPSPTAGTTSRWPVPSCRHAARRRPLEPVESFVVASLCRLGSLTLSPVTACTATKQSASLPVARMNRPGPTPSVSRRVEPEDPRDGPLCVPHPTFPEHLASPRCHTEVCHRRHAPLLGPQSLASLPTPAEPTSHTGCPAHA